MAPLMFPEAPAPTVPITFVEDPDLDALLVEFPNHLVIQTVMEHFCAPMGDNIPEHGYVTREMAERLSVHKNSIDGLDSDAEHRITNLIIWIKRRKDAANARRRRRKARGEGTDLIPFEGQCLAAGSANAGDANMPDEDEDDGAPTALGLRLSRRAEDALAKCKEMMAAKKRSDKNEDPDYDDRPSKY
jgi:hypothetical protein